MDAEQTIAEIDWLERFFAVPDTRPLSASDIAAANRRRDDSLAHGRGFACGSVMASVAEPSPQCFD